MFTRQTPRAIQRLLLKLWLLFVLAIIGSADATGATPQTCADLFNDCISDDFGELQQCYRTLSKVYEVQLDGVCLPPSTNEKNAEAFQHWAYQNKMTKSETPALECALTALTDTYSCHPKFSPAP